MKPEVKQLGMPTASETAAILAEHGVMEAPHGMSQPLGTVGVLIQMADPPPPPLNCWGWYGRPVAGARVGFEYIPRSAEETLDEFRLRLAYAYGGLGTTATYCYPKGTK